MTTTEHLDTEARLSRALHGQAAAVPESTPPSLRQLTSDGRTAVRPRRRLLSRVVAITAPIAVAAAVVVAVLASSNSTPGSGTTNAASGAVDQVAFLRPGGTALMTPGQFFYRKEISTVANGQSLVVELWQPQSISDTWTVKTYQQDANGTVIGTPNVQTGACGQFLKVASTTAAPTCNPAGSWSMPTAAFLTTLPTEPQALYQQLSAYILADYKTTADDRRLNFSTDNIAFLTINYIRGIASNAGGMSEPFSKALQGAAALVPGVVVKHNVKNLTGGVGTSYEVDASPTNIAGPLIFDANGNFIGSPTSAVTLGVADQAGGVAQTS